MRPLLKEKIVKNDCLVIVKRKKFCIRLLFKVAHTGEKVSLSVETKFSETTIHFSKFLLSQFSVICFVRKLLFGLIFLFCKANYKSDLIVKQKLLILFMFCLFLQSLDVINVQDLLYVSKAILQCKGSKKRLIT